MEENDELLDLQMYDQFAGRFIMDKESCRILLSFLYNEMQTCPELSTIFPTVNGWQVKLARRNVVFVAVDQEARVRRAVENYQLANAVKFEGTITLNNGMCIVPLDSLRFYGQSIDHYAGRGAERMNHLAIDHEGEEYDATQGVPPAIDLPPRIKGVGTTNLADAQARYAAGTPQLTSMSNYPRPILNESLRSIERR